jgi:hypothetical protein
MLAVPILAKLHRYLSLLPIIILHQQVLLPIIILHKQILPAITLNLMVAAVKIPIIKLVMVMMAIIIMSTII